MCASRVERPSLAGRTWRLRLARQSRGRGLPTGRARVFESRLYSRRLRWPLTVQVLLVVAWLVVQARKLCGRWYELPEERKSEGADSDSD